MAFVQAYKSRILAGSVNLAIQADEMSMDTTINPIPTTTFANSDGTDQTEKSFIPGMSDSTFSAAGPLDTDTTDATTAFNILTAWKASNLPLPLTYAPSGLTTGDEAFLIDGLQTSYTSSSTVDGRADFALDAQTSGPADAGHVVEDLTAITTTGNGTSRDFTAQTTNGGVAHLHVTAWSGLTSNDVTIEHSSTGSSAWSVIATFTQTTGLTAERVVIAAGTTVKQYLRVVDTVVGTGSTTRAVSFARR